MHRSAAGERDSANVAVLVGEQSRKQHTLDSKHPCCSSSSNFARPARTPLISKPGSGERARAPLCLGRRRLRPEHCRFILPVLGRNDRLQSPQIHGAIACGVVPAGAGPVCAVMRLNGGDNGDEVWDVCNSSQQRPCRREAGGMQLRCYVRPRQTLQRQLRALQGMGLCGIVSTRPETPAK